MKIFIIIFIVCNILGYYLTKTFETNFITLFYPAIFGLTFLLITKSKIEMDTDLNKSLQSTIIAVFVLFIGLSMFVGTGIRILFK